MLNAKSIEAIIAMYKNDKGKLDFVKSLLDSFEAYHKAVFDDQIFLVIYGGGALEADDYRDKRTEVDKTRSTYHDSLITNVGILNRLAEKAGVPPVYDGLVSQQRPYRRMIANAVFEYVEYIINKTLLLNRF